MPNLIRMRKWRPQDKQSILRLINLVQPHIKMSETRWEWQYIRNPDGRPEVWLAEDGEKIIAHYAAIPHDLSISGQARIGYMVQDVMTHPDYRERGIYNQMSIEATKVLCNQKHPLNYTFPNEYSLHAFLRNGWVKAFRIPLLINTRIGTYSRECHNAVGNVHLTQVSSFEKDADEFALQIKGIFKFAISRSSGYLNWRYAEKPGGQYTLYIAREKKEIVGILVLKKFIESRDFIKTHIIDLLVLPGADDILRLLYSKALDFSIQQNSDELSYWLPDYHPYFQICQEFGFEKREVERYFVVFARESAISLGEASNPGNWHLAMGDSDVY